MISECLLLKGCPIDIGKCKIYPLTIGEIVEVIGESQYTRFLSTLMLDRTSLDISGISSPEDKREFNKLSPYGALINHAHNSEFMALLISTSLAVFIKEEITYHPKGYFYIGNEKENRIITSEDFELIKEIITKQNYIDNSTSTSEFNPANDRAKQLLEKMKKAKEKMQKQNKTEGLNLADTISIVSNFSNDINILSVWNLKIYQLYECYLRILMWDDYHNNFTLVPHVTDNSSLNLKHWASKINK
jgi:uncharacterized protein (UPF0147 family)